MPDLNEFVTVFRSADAGAESDAASIRDRLIEAGIDAVLLGDDAPGVVVGTYEVRVPAADSGRAERLVNETPIAAEEEDMSDIDGSSDLDLVSFFSSSNLDAELEANAIQGILEASGIPSVIVGSPQIPVLPFEVKVPKSRLAEAERIVSEAKIAGPAAAEEAEAASENAL